MLLDGQEVLGDTLSHGLRLDLYRFQIGHVLQILGIGHEAVLRQHRGANGLPGHEVTLVPFQHRAVIHICLIGLLVNLLSQQLGIGRVVHTAETVYIGIAVNGVLVNGDADIRRRLLIMLQTGVDVEPGVAGAVHNHCCASAFQFLLQRQSQHQVQLCLIPGFSLCICSHSTAVHTAVAHINEHRHASEVRTVEIIGRRHLDGIQELEAQLTLVVIIRMPAIKTSGLAQVQPQGVVRLVLDQLCRFEQRMIVRDGDLAIETGGIAEGNVHNKFYNNVYTAVEDAMQKLESVTGRHYAPFEYVGDKNAKLVIVAMGSSTETIDETINFLNQTTREKIGLVKVRLYRPFNVQKFVEVLPKTVKKIAVLDRTKESGAVCEPLCADVVNALSFCGKNVEVVGGRYGLGGKEFTPKCVKAVIANLSSKTPKNGFTVGINDDVTNLSLPLDENFVLPQKNFAMKFYGLGSDGTVGANKNTIKIIGEKTNKFVQGYFEYDSKKSGSMTVSHLRVSDKPIKSTYLIEKANLIAIHNYSFVARYDILENLQNSGVVLLNTALSEKELSVDLPQKFVETLKEKNAKLYVVDASKIAQDVGLGNKINTIMQSAFFAVSDILEESVYMAELKNAIIKTYGRKGDAVVNMNLQALNMGKTEIKHVDVKGLLGRNHKKSVQTKNKYYLEVIEPINTLKGNTLSVSKFSADGSVPTGTTQFEKRGISEKCPQWKSENCIQCGLCSLACPHAAIRAHLVTEENLKNAPKFLQHIKATGREDSIFSTFRFITVHASAICLSIASICFCNSYSLLFKRLRSTFTPL